MLKQKLLFILLCLPFSFAEIPFFAIHEREKRKSYEKKKVFFCITYLNVYWWNFKKNEKLKEEIRQ